VEACDCRIWEMVEANVEKGYSGLMKYKSVKESPFTGHLTENLGVTGETNWFFPNLRHVVMRQIPTWGFRVITDADLMNAWLATMVVEGHKMHDPEVADMDLPSMTHLSLVDIALPPDLLIIKLGVKAARNVAMPEVLLEAINQRLHIRRATWVWDQHGKPLVEGHLCYSREVEDTLATWEHIRESWVSTPTSTGGTGSGGLRDALFGHGAVARTESIPDPVLELITGGKDEPTSEEPPPSPTGAPNEPALNARDLLLGIKTPPSRGSTPPSRGRSR